jgi:hypothetical protein
MALQLAGRIYVDICTRTVGSAGRMFVDMSFEQAPGGALIVVTAEELDFDLAPMRALPCLYQSHAEQG